MGRDKAFLVFRGQLLLQVVADAVKTAAGNVSLVGRSSRLAALGMPVLDDTVEGRGPLGGIHTVLRATSAEWNLVLACDMPRIEASFLSALLDGAVSQQADAVLAQNPQGLPEPLCAVYRRTCLPTVEQALAQGRLKVTDALAGLRVCFMPVTDPSWLMNVNTPEDWARLAGNDRD